MNEIMPRHGIQPDTYTYNTILAGLARVGDTDKAKELLLEMTNKGVRLDGLTVQALVDGKLNMGDVPGAVTLVQDLFNQHNVLPPYRTHLKILEFALASGLVYEARRYVYVIQQFWKWEPNEYHDPEFVEEMNQLKDNRKLSREALKKLFDYFGETLEDKDFF
jgi:pentatricopeptide repeat protein